MFSRGHNLCVRITLLYCAVLRTLRKSSVYNNYSTINCTVPLPYMPISYVCVHTRCMYTVYEVQVARRPGVQYIVYRYTPGSTR